MSPNARNEKCKIHLEDSRVAANVEESCVDKKRLHSHKHKTQCPREESLLRQEWNPSRSDSSLVTALTELSRYQVYHPSY